MRARTSNASGTSNIRYRFSPLGIYLVIYSREDEWPWQIVIETEFSGQLHQYWPHNNLGLWKNGFPRLLVGVEGTDSNDQIADYNRLKFQGAAVVKITSAILGKQRTSANHDEKGEDDNVSDFFLLVLYLRRRGPADSLLMFKKGSEVSHRVSIYY
jgi:hypothetical protein